MRFGFHREPDPVGALAESQGVTDDPIVDAYAEPGLFERFSNGGAQGGFLVVSFGMTF